MKRFTIKFTEKSLTSTAGLVHIGRFVQKLGLQQMLERHLTIRRGVNANYTYYQSVREHGSGSVRTDSASALPVGMPHNLEGGDETPFQSCIS